MTQSRITCAVCNLSFKAEDLFVPIHKFPDYPDGLVFSPLGGLAVTQIAHLDCVSNSGKLALGKHMTEIRKLKEGTK